MAEQLKNSLDNPTSTLASGITAAATSLTVASGHGARFPATGTFRVKLTDVANDALYELVICTARATDTLTVTRAAEGTTARAFNAADKVDLVLSAAALTSYVSENGPGYEVAFAQVTSNVTVTATVEASSNTIVTLGAVTYADVPHIFQFSWPTVDALGTQAILVSLFDGSTQVCRIWQFNLATTGQWGGGVAQVRYTPTAGTHTFSVRGFKAGGTSHTYFAGNPPAAGVLASLQLRALVA